MTHDRKLPAPSIPTVVIIVDPDGRFYKFLTDGPVDVIVRERRTIQPTDDIDGWYTQLSLPFDDIARGANGGTGAARPAEQVLKEPATATEGESQDTTPPLGAHTGKETHDGLMGKTTGIVWERPGGTSDPDDTTGGGNGKGS